MTQPTTPNATPGKSIYLDGFVLEGYEKSYSSYSYTNRISCPAPHPFTNYQDVTGLYRIEYKRIDTANGMKAEPYALPLQNDNKEGEKESRLIPTKEELNQPDFMGVFGKLEKLAATFDRKHSYHKDEAKRQLSNFNNDKTDTGIHIGKSRVYDEAAMEIRNILYGN